MLNLSLDVVFGVLMPCVDVVR